MSKEEAVVAEVPVTEVEPEAPAAQEAEKDKAKKAPMEKKGKGKNPVRRTLPTLRLIAKRILMSVKKGQREMASSDSNSVSGSPLARDMKLRSDTRNGNKELIVSSQQSSPSTRRAGEILPRILIHS